MHLIRIKAPNEQAMLKWKSKSKSKYCHSLCRLRCNVLLRMSYYLTEMIAQVVIWNQCVRKIVLNWNYEVIAIVTVRLCKYVGYFLLLFLLFSLLFFFLFSFVAFVWFATKQSSILCVFCFVCVMIIRTIVCVCACGHVCVYECVCTSVCVHMLITSISFETKTAINTIRSSASLLFLRRI